MENVTITKAKLNEGLERDEFLKKLILSGIEQNVIELIESPHGGGTVCAIIDNWFCFLDFYNEGISVSEILSRYNNKELTFFIFNAMCSLDENEYNYYINYMLENVEI